MNSTRFKSICEMIFGRSWQAQVADYLMISRKTVSSWIERGSVPPWVDQEIKPLVIRRSKEAQFALQSFSINQNEFDHNQAILNGEVHHYDQEKYNFQDVEKFIENQKWRVLESVKYLITQDNSIDEIKSHIESDFLSENDISDCLEHIVNQDELIEIQNLRTDASFEVKDIANSIYERVKNVQQNLK